MAALLREGYTAAEIREALAGPGVVDSGASPPPQSPPGRAGTRRGVGAGSGPPDNVEEAQEGGPGGPRSGSGSPLAFSDYAPLSGSKYATRKRAYCGGAGGRPPSPVIFTDISILDEVEGGGWDGNDKPPPSPLLQAEFVANPAGATATARVAEVQAVLEEWFSRIARCPPARPSHPPLSTADNPITRPLSLPPALLTDGVRASLFAAEKTLIGHRPAIATSR